MYQCPVSNMASTDSLMIGMSDEPGETIDGYFSATIREHLFAFGDDQGFDLPALNVQRGRDHGIAGAC